MCVDNTAVLGSCFPDWVRAYVHITGVAWVLPDLGCSLIVRVALSVQDRWTNQNQVVSVLTMQPLPLPSGRILSPSGVITEIDLRTDHALFPVMDAVICFAQTLRRKLVRADLEISNPKDNFSESIERWKMRAIKEVFR